MFHQTAVPLGALPADDAPTQSKQLTCGEGAPTPLARHQTISSLCHRRPGYVRRFCCRPLLPVPEPHPLGYLQRDSRGFPVGSLPFLDFGQSPAQSRLNRKAGAATEGHVWSPRPPAASRPVASEPTKQPKLCRAERETASLLQSNATGLDHCLPVASRKLVQQRECFVPHLLRAHGERPEPVPEDPLAGTGAATSRSSPVSLVPWGSTASARAVAATTERIPRPRPSLYLRYGELRNHEPDAAVL